MAHQQPHAAPAAMLETVEATSSAVGKPALGADAPAAQEPPADTARPRRTTANWFTHFKRESPTLERQQEFVSNAVGLRRTSSNADLSLDERPSRMRRMGEAATSTGAEVDEDMAVPSVPTVTMDADSDFDFDEANWDLDSEDARLLHASMEEVDQNLDGETVAPQPSASERDDLIQEEASLQAATVHNELSIGAASPVASPRETRSAQLEKAAFCRQAAYLLVRELQGRPLSDEHQALMWRVSKVRTEVLKMLPMGRSNVTTDVLACNTDRSNGPGMHSTFRALAARELKFSVTNASRDEHSYIRAALTAIAGSGSCGDHSLLALHLLGPAMEPGDRALRQKQKGDEALDHSWVRVECAASGVMSDNNPAVILDVWADGPVIDPVDCAFVNGDELESGDFEIEELENMGDFGKKSEHGWDQSTCQQAHQAFLAFKQNNAATLEARITAMAQKREQDYLAEHAETEGDPLIDFENGKLSKIVTWTPTPVLHQAFIDTLAFLRAAYSQNDGSPSDRLNTTALRIAKTAPEELQHIASEGLARDIIGMFHSLHDNEVRSLLRDTPLQLGLIP